MPPSKEVKQMAGFNSAKDLRGAMPDNVDDATRKDGETKVKRPRTPRATSSVPRTPDPMEDPRYAQACAEMTAFGGKGMIVRGFDAGARALNDDEFKLNKDEEHTWDNFFYVLSKKPMFDVGKPLFLALFFVVTLFSQLGWRVFERTASENSLLRDLFTKKEKVNEPPTPDPVRAYRA